MQIIIRNWSRDDMDWLLQLANNRNIAQNLDDGFPSPYHEEDAEAWLELCVDGEEKDHHFVIEYNGEPVGCIGAIPGKGSYARKVFIGYWLGEEYWGKGIMTEAVRQICEMIWEKYPDVVRIETHVFSYNPGSKRVLEKNGFELEATMKKKLFRGGQFHDEIHFAKFRE